MRLRQPVAFAWIKWRAARVSTQPIKMSKLDTTVFVGRFSATSVQFRSQKRFRRLTMTTTFRNPIYAETNGCQTSRSCLVREFALKEGALPKQNGVYAHILRRTHTALAGPSSFTIDVPIWRDH